jgi:hypothetical protein
MTAAASLYRSFGALSLPLDASDPATNLASLDPARDILLDLFAAAITAELSGVWAAAVAGSALSDSSPVQQKLPSMPTPEALAEMKTGWPLLCVSRATSGQSGFSDFTLEMRQLVQRWDIDYILCPLTLGNLLRVQDVLPTVGKTFEMVIEKGGHAAYRSVQVGNSFLTANALGSGENCCNFWRCEVKDMALGPASFSSKDPKYYACGLTLETVEIVTELDGESVPLDGVTGTFGLTQSGDPSIIVRG